MRQIWVAICLTTFILAGLANAADQVHKAGTSRIRRLVSARHRTPCNLKIMLLSDAVPEEIMEEDAKAQ
jgi:hypothetical protein